jgi:glycerol-3-phosphate dehydrogenase subunit B
MHYDLIVIGMGLSGLMAAKTAADQGKRVLVIGKGMGTLVMFSHTIDLLGTLPLTAKVKEVLPQWIDDHPEHPYAKAGLEKVDDALSSFNAFFQPPYSFQARDERNSLIPTAAGTLRPTYLLPSTMMKGVGIQGKKTLIVGFNGFKDFYAQRVADLLKCRAVTLSLPERPQGEWTATALARSMEQAPFRDAVAAEIKKHLTDESLVGFPAVLGLNDPTGARKDLEKRTGASIFEIPVLPPSIPGLRVFNRFKARLLQKGATFLLGYAVSKVIVRGKRCEGIEVFHPPVTHAYSADRFLLATGRFIGGGLQAERERITEPLFGLPVAQPLGRQDWFQRTFFSDQSHPVHGSGIVVDSSFRPVDARGIPLLENVRVAGTILAHHHCIEEKSREGIEISTGYAAAKMALEQ